MAYDKIIVELQRTCQYLNKTSTPHATFSNLYYKCIANIVKKLYHLVGHNWEHQFKKELNCVK